MSGERSCVSTIVIVAGLSLWALSAADCDADEGSRTPPSDTGKKSALVQPSSGKKPESIARPAFVARDKNGDGKLSEEEFVQAASEADRPLVRRDFRLLDLDRDGLMTFDEFRNVPYLVPRHERGALPDPVARLVEQKFDASLEKWSEFDANDDGVLDLKEVRAAGLIGVNVRDVNGDVQSWSILDRDQNGSVSRDEWYWQLEVWYGARRPQGELLRAPSGILINWMYFKYSDRDRNDRIDPMEFVNFGFDGDQAEKRFAEMNENGDDVISFEEWSKSDTRQVDLFWMFRGLDTDLDARLDRDELMKNIADWQRSTARYMFPGFDSNRDGFLSLEEFALTPLYLHFVEWHATKVDKDGDRRLSMEEFQFETGPSLKGLTAEFFRRLDTNENGFLDEGEWAFQIPEAPKSRLFVMNADGSGLELLADVGLFDATYIGSPDWSPDGSTIVFDATPAQGVHSDFSRSLIVTLGMAGPQKGKFQKLGFGNCPDWSPDGKQVTFFVNGGNPNSDAAGVWIANSDGAGRRLIGPNMWNPRWSPDGKQVLCCSAFRAPKDYVLVDVASGQSRRVLTDVQGLGVPDWDPSGKRVCVMRLVGEERRLSLIDIDGTSDTSVDLWKSGFAIPEGSYYYDNSRPCVSADGLEVLFADSSSGNSRLRRVKTDGKTESQPLSAELAHADVNAVWSPDRKRIVFVSTQPPQEMPGLKPPHGK